MRALEHAASIVAGYSDDKGEQFAMQMIFSVPVAEVPVNSVVVIPLNTPKTDEVLNFTFLAASKLLYLQVHEKPQTRMTYGHCANFSAGTMDRPIPIGALVKFPLMSNYLVAQPRLLQALHVSLEPTGGDATGEESAKRPCIRPLEGGGEQAEDTASKAKGMSIIDLEGGEHPTRNKADIHQRERELWLTYRIMDAPKQCYSIGSDVTLQPDHYLGMLYEQGDTQAADRHPTFLSCGLINRIERLPVLAEIGKLKLLLVGSVLTDNGAPTLCLEDFISGEKITCKPSPCPSNNAGLMAALKNVQLVMQVCFSNFFGKALESFIDKLEGASRPMELVASDFLKHSVQHNLKRFFREVSSVRGSDVQDGVSFKSPELCAAYLTSLFNKLAEDLSDHPMMVRRDAHFRLRSVRPTVSFSSEKTLAKKEVVSGKVEKSAASAVTPTDVKKENHSRICIGHLGQLLEAVDKDGRPYKCKFEKDCAFRHVTIEDKSRQRLLDIVGSFTTIPRADLTRAVDKRS